MNQNEILEQANRVLGAWSRLKPQNAKMIQGGLLNHTFHVRCHARPYILQRLNPIFLPSVNEDFDAITQHLHKKGLIAPLLVFTDQGAPSVEMDDHCFRMQTFIRGKTCHSIQSEDMAHAAGELVGGFHLALLDCAHDYQFSRVGVHDTRAHLRRLEKDLLIYHGHDLFDEVKVLAEPLLKASEGLPDFSQWKKRHSHGDLKISNVRFDGESARALIDFDTLGLMPWAVEMGDAFRSWCNPNREDLEQVSFGMSIFSAALQGYCAIAKPFWSKEETEQLFEGICAIPLELSVRFLADAMEQSYFAWDPSRYASRGLHNLARARGQWALFLDIQKKQRQIEEQIRNAFA